ncbi:hypothetical protein CROQUDRAFT_669777 [Cronartium quercuum f. sp. fusiforme G11]|uniref:RNA helicase n=1 Tax=Cronartium quercuum f. sp. fusiforme G11 TaxID=708437 RepID=A0A9P6TDV5_9BASI|nr:hypothetical protein CROQUDRAFT_669777 [Cronartium quercuum f. sp. fusiforme G11]
MPPKQKKKVLKKPANRGFATTSIPKKVAEPDPSELSESATAKGLNAEDASQALIGSATRLTLDAACNGADTENGEKAEENIPGQDEWDLEAEDRELQSLAEKLRPVCEKEIAKQFKTLEFDRRAAKAFPGLRWSDSRVQSQILDLARTNQQAGEDFVKAPGSSNGDDDEKLLQRLAVLYGVLDKLGYPKSRIEDCLGTIKMIDFEEAMDYLLLHCTNEELTMAGHVGLACQQHALSNLEKEVKSSAADSLINFMGEDSGPTPDTSADIDSSFALSNMSLEDHSSLVMRSSLHSVPATPIQPVPRRFSIDNPSLDVKDEILVYSKTQSDSTDDDPSPIENYVALKLSLIELSKKIPRLGTTHLKGKALKDAAKHKKEVKTIEDKIKLVQAGYTFNQREADKAFKDKLNEAKLAKTGDDTAEGPDGSFDLDNQNASGKPTQPTDLSLSITAFRPAHDDDSDSTEADSVQRTLRNEAGDQSDSSLQMQDASRVVVRAPDSPRAVIVNANSSDLVQNVTRETAEDEDPSLFGAMFTEESAGPPSGEQTCNTQDNKTGAEVKNRLVITRDMPLPKHFMGKTPQSLLEESVKRLDKYAQPRYFVTSGGSRAVKASVEIKWQDRKMVQEYGGSLNGTSFFSSNNPVQTFTMEDEACRDENQAYNYVATAALFHLNAHNPSAVHRNLPSMFRELWDEFEEKRKRDDDKGYLEHLRGLMNILKARMAPHHSPTSEDKSVPRTVKSSGEGSVLADGDAPLTASRMVWPDFTDVTLMEEFALRQQWPTYQYMLRYRASLPIAVYRSIIVNTIDQNQVVVLCGETGCGKSTQLPAFILEHELSNGRAVKIFCTEPRRISAISLAQRVSQELGEPNGAVGQMGSLVGYNIRLESRTSPTTRLVYATTGIVLRMLENGTDLQEITHLIIDEVHERSIDSDFLLIALRTILERRPNLRLILMSATVDAEKISNYMNGCPILKIPGRTFPVTSFFLEDAIELTGYHLDKRSDSPYVARLVKRKIVALKTAGYDDDIPTLDDDEDPSGNGVDPSRLAHTYANSTRDTLEVLDEHQINMDLILLLLEQICVINPSLVERFSNAILIFLPSLDTIRKLTEILESHHIFGTNAFQIFPLHSSISNEHQGLVFQTPPPGVRKIVISTNIAETGITIPDVTCVIDSGKHREMRYDEKRQISRLVETFIARSNATQRKGRAGRVQEGICFHLFTKHRMENQLAENPLPEMLRLSLQDLALRIKIMKIGTSIEDVLSKALDPPAIVNVQRAIASLVEVKALTPNEEITPLGRHLVKLPMDVHMGKLLILGCLFRCLTPALTVAAALNSKSPFLTPFGREQEAEAIKRSFKVENSDFLTICNVYNTWRDAYRHDHVHQFCRKNLLSLQNLMQIEELRIQFFGYLLDAGFIDLESDQRTYSNSRSKFCTVPAAYDTNAHDPKIVMGCVGAAMFPKLLIRDNNGFTKSGYSSQTQGAWRTMSNSAPASIHPSSVNYTSGRRPDFGDAKFVTYFNIMQSKKLYVWESGVVDEKAIFLLCGEADFKLPAQSVILDRKIKASMNPKTLLALKLLRQRFQLLFNQKMKNPSKPLSENQQKWFDLIVIALKDEKDLSGGLLSDKNQPGRLANAEAAKKKTMTVVLAPARKEFKRTASADQCKVRPLEPHLPAAERPPPPKPGAIIYETSSHDPYGNKREGLAGIEAQAYTTDPHRLPASSGPVSVNRTLGSTPLNPNAPIWNSL